MTAVLYKWARGSFGAKGSRRRAPRRLGSYQAAIWIFFTFIISRFTWWCYFLKNTLEFKWRSIFIDLIARPMPPQHYGGRQIMLIWASHILNVISKSSVTTLDNFEWSYPSKTIDWCCFYYSIRNCPVTLLEALFVRIIFKFEISACSYSTPGRITKKTVSYSKCMIISKCPD